MLTDIPLEKNRESELRKSCAQAGALSQADQLCSTYVPRFLKPSFQPYKRFAKVSPLVSEQTRPPMFRTTVFLNIIATIRGKPYPIDVIKMDACKHSTIKSSHHPVCKTSADITFEHVFADVRESAVIREYASTLYVGLARAVSPTNTNFRLTFLLTRLQEALYEDLAV